MHHDAAAAGEPDDVPDHQEIACQIELADDAQLVRKLGPHFVGHGLIASGGALPGHRLQKALLGFTVGDRVAGKAVTEIGEGEPAALGDFVAARHRGGQVAKQGGHFFRSLEKAFGVAGQPAADLVDRDPGADAGEHVVGGASIRGGVAHVVAGDHRESAGSGLGEHGAVLPLLLGVEVSLHLKKGASAAKQRRQIRGIGARGGAEQRKQAGRVLGQHFHGRSPFAFAPSLLHAGDEPTQVAVAASVFHQEQHGRRRARRTCR